ncbi:hypothetical protein N7541_002326 [Penicillium brevicompactum]|uniref:Vesicle-mediated transport protein Vid24 n=1 Tax=Penicillium brevicompactum TaxID=5074 RepID=A0A9W9UXV9_PENBR|nr:hypothetical protein N7541_002326 [Penicillium brevicompactum]
MPTPSDNTPIEAISTRTCPEPDRPVWRDSEHSEPIDVISPERAAEPSALSRPDDGSVLAPTKAAKLTIVDDEPEPIRATSPAESTCIRSQSPTLPQSSSSLLSWEFSNVRLLPNHTSSFLRSGSKFIGTQQSDRSVYNVDVEIKHVDMAESYLCGYLRIQGLTEDHPTLTTFFEGEIIGTKHTFQTRNEEWGASEKTDLHHWSRFPAWRPLAKQAKRADFTYRNFAQREHIFMRWKESFLVPDHRVRTISGASFEGFYYICFNQIEGTVSGVYFHAKSERFQQLELKHVEDRGCAPAVEFR